MIGSSIIGWRWYLSEAHKNLETVYSLGKLAIHISRMWLLWLALIVPARSECPHLITSSDDQSFSADEAIQGQWRGRGSSTSGQLFAKGLIHGGNMYGIVSDGSGWPFLFRFPNRAALIAHPPTVTTDNPFSIELPWDALDCLLDAKVGALVSDGTYNHLTMFWRIDRARRMYSFADSRPDEFFLANKNNLFGIAAKREKIKNGLIVHWITESDFRTVLKEIFWLANYDNFNRVYEFNSSAELKARIAYSAFLSFAVSDDEASLENSLKFALRVFENYNRLTAKQKRNFPYELASVLAIVRMVEGKRQSVGMLPPQIRLNSGELLMYKINERVIKFDGSLRSELTRRLKEMTPTLSSENLVDIGLNTLFENVEVTLARRLIMTISLYTKSDEAFRIIETARTFWPDDPRMIMYSAMYELKNSAPRAALTKLQEAISNIEKIMLASAHATSLTAFREAITDYQIHFDSAEVPYAAWTRLVTATRRQAEQMGSNELAQQLARRELFSVYTDGEADAFCAGASRYAKEERSKALKAVVARLRSADWFGVYCRSRGNRMRVRLQARRS